MYMSDYGISSRTIVGKIVEKLDMNESIIYGSSMMLSASSA
jgi:hypothetical protein